MPKSRIPRRGDHRRPQTRQRTHSAASRNRNRRTKATSQQRELEELLEKVFASPYSMIAFLDRDCNFIRVNQAYSQADGRDPSFFPGKNHFALYPNPENEAIFRRVLETGEPYYAHAKPFEYAEHPERGTSYWDWSLFPLHDSQKRVDGLLLNLVNVTERATAEQQLRQSEARFRTSVENLLDAFAVLSSVRDSSGRIIDFRYEYVNDAGCRANRMARDELIGRCLTEVLPAHKGNPVFDEYVQVVETARPLVKESFFYEDVYAGKRLARAFDFNATKVGDGIAVSWRDVTNRVVGQQALREARDEIECHAHDLEQRVSERTAQLQSTNEELRVEIEHREHAEAQLRLQLAALESAANGIVMTDRNGTIEWVNSAFTRLTGYGRDEVIGGNPRLLKSGEHDRAYYQNLWSCILSGQVWHGEVKNRRKDGTLYVEEMTITPVRQTGTEVTHFIAIKQDVTARRKADQALRESERRYRSLFDNMLNGFAYCQMLFDEQDHPIDFVYLDVNAAFERLTGLRDVIGKKVTDVIPSIRDEHAELFEVYGRVARTGRPEEIVLDFKPLAMWLSLSVYSPARGYFVAVFDNITERKRAEERIQKLNEALEQRAQDLETANEELRVAYEESNEANTNLQAALHRIETLNQNLQRRADDLVATNRELEAFSYSVSHDLRTPLSGVEGFSQLLLNEYVAQMDATAQGFLRMVHSNAQHANALILGLHAFSRSGSQPLNRQIVQPAELVQQALTTLEAEQTGRKVEISTGELPTCEGDPLLLGEVWVNLIGNALKYTRMCPLAKIEIGCQNHTDSGEMVYFVRDNGVGFDMQGAGHLFGVFQRLHDADEYEGTGIGLAIAQRIIHRHGGRIWAEAAPGQGATFYFTLGRGERE